jgi:tRNA nucleotidyltransferase (CCA-adding enzyme)
MADLLSKLDNQLRSLITEVGQIASQLGFKAYLVGGPVRDLMLKSSHVDLDVTIEGNGIAVAQRFAANHSGSKIESYPAFKTATVMLPDGQAVDFATARKETYKQGGVFPAVTPSNIKNDLFRRDFTINAIAIAINPKVGGKMVDPFKGEQDLKKKKIRILHEKSFLDDPTRILRAARFKSRLGFHLEQETLHALKSAIAQGALETIKPQRYQKELKKILKEKTCKQAIACLKLWKAYKSH